MINAVIEELKTHQTQLDQDGVMVGVSRQALEELLAHVATSAQPAPIAGLEPVPSLRLCGYCKSWNSKPCGEQCCLQLSDPVWTDAEPAQDRPAARQYLHHDPLSGSPVWLEKSFWNGHQANQSRPLYTRSQLEAHAAEQVRAEREVCASIIDARCAEVLSRQYSDDPPPTEFEQSVNTNLRLTAALLPDLSAAIRARGQV